MSSALACELFSSSCTTCVEQYCSYYLTNLGNFCAKDTDSFFNQKITNENEYLCSIVDALIPPVQTDMTTAATTISTTVGTSSSSTTSAPSTAAEPKSLETGDGINTLLIIISLMAALVLGAVLSRFSRQIRESLLRHVISNMILGCSRIALLLAPNATEVPLPYVRFGSPSQTSTEAATSTMDEISNDSSTTVSNPVFDMKPNDSESQTVHFSRTGSSRPPPPENPAAMLPVVKQSEFPTGPATRLKAKAGKNNNDTKL